MITILCLTVIMALMVLLIKLGIVIAIIIWIVFVGMCIYKLIKYYLLENEKVVEKKKEIINLRVTKREKEKAQTRADFLGISLSKYITTLIEKDIEKKWLKR